MDPEEFPSRKQLDKAGKRFKRFKEEPRDRRIIKAYRDFRAAQLPEIFEKIAASIQGMPAVLSARAKRTDTIIRKLRREGSMQLTSMADVVGFRIIVDSPATQENVVSALERDLDLVERQKRDYVANPTASGYRGVHLVGATEQKLPSSIEPNNFTYEIQVRTEYQHIWSTTSESFGEQVKEGGGAREHREYLRALSKNISIYEAASPAAHQRDVGTNDKPPSYDVFVFDKKRGQTITRFAFGQDLATASRQFASLEDKYSINYSKEVVLLSSSEPESVLEVTHRRYFDFQGRPIIPDIFGFAMPRPE